MIPALQTIIKPKQRFFAMRILIILAAAGSSLRGEAAQKPNIIIILADDLGYSDIGVNGCKDIPTPHIDRIAKNGVRFTQGYAAHPVCAPSRAGLMSGLYQHRFGFENNSGPERTAPPNFGLPREVPTLAEKLKAAGYATGIIGKWHLGFKDGLRPNERGFDYFYGFVGGSRSYNPEKSQENDPLLRNGEVVTDEKEYLTDAFGREAVDFIQRNSKSESTADSITSSTSKPYFLYLSLSAVHLPMEATPPDLARFPDIPDKKRKTYAAMLASMDDAIGDVMTKVRELGEEDNTLVFFYSDNGGPTSYTTSRNAPLRGSKSDLYEGGIRVPFVMQWKGKVPGGMTYTEPVMGFDCHATALAAAAIPDDSLDGKDLLPYLLGRETSAPHSFLCWRFNQRKAIRMGDWKLVQQGSDSAAELFNLGGDISEQNDLAAEEPAKRHELAARLAEWEKAMKPAAWASREGKRN